MGHMIWHTYGVPLKIWCPPKDIAQLQRLCSKAVFERAGAPKPEQYSSFQILPSLPRHVFPQKQIGQKVDGSGIITAALHTNAAGHSSPKLRWHRTATGSSFKLQSATESGVV